MTLKITKDELMLLNPCHPEDYLALFKRRKTMNVAQALKAGASIRNVLWVAGKLGRKDLCISFALACAVRVEKFDGKGIAKACNAATAAYIRKPSAKNLDTLDKARLAAHVHAARAAAADAARAYVADAAAVAADAAAAADVTDHAYVANANANAGYAAVNAVNAAAYVAYAAYAPAYAAHAAHAADVARRKEIMAQSKIMLRIFK